MNKLSMAPIAVIAIIFMLISSSVASQTCVNQVPFMRSNSTPSGMVSTSGVINSSYPAWRAFDSSSASMWISKIDQNPAWLAYRFPTSRVISRYSLSYKNGTITSRAPKDWQFQGRTGASWITLDTRSNQTNWAGSETRSFNVSTPGTYTEYRLLFTDDNDSRSGIVVISLGGVTLENCGCTAPSSIQINQQTGQCPGQLFTFSATPFPFGSSGSYFWTAVNGSIQGSRTGRSVSVNSPPYLGFSMEVRYTACGRTVHGVTLVEFDSECGEIGPAF